MEGFTLGREKDVQSVLLRGQTCIQQYNHLPVAIHLSLLQLLLRLRNLRLDQVQITRHIKDGNVIDVLSIAKLANKNSYNKILSKILSAIVPLIRLSHKFTHLSYQLLS